MAEASIRKAVIVGATGPTGVHLAQSLRARGIEVRVASRSRENLEQHFSADEYELFPADATDRAETLRAVEGCDLVCDAIGLPGDQMDLHAVTAASIAAAVRQTGARCLQVSSFWAYLPLEYIPLNERHPREGGNPWIERRREAEDILRAAGAAIVHLPDFFGPLVHTSTLQQPLREAAQGQTMNWIGSLDAEHEFAYIPDAMETVAQLALRDEAYGERWIVPGAGPLSGEDVRALVSKKLGHEAKMRGAGLWTLRLVSLFSKDLRGFLQMVPEYLKPLVYDGSKLRALLGDLPMRPYAESIGATLDWLKAPRTP